MGQVHDFTFRELADCVVVDFNKDWSCRKTRRLMNLLGSVLKAQSSPADWLSALLCFAAVAPRGMKAFRKLALEVGIGSGSTRMGLGVLLDGHCQMWVQKFTLTHFANTTKSSRVSNL